MNIRFSELNSAEQAQIVNNRNYEMHTAQSQDPLLQQLISALSAFGVALPASVKLSGPGLPVLVAAVASAAAAKKLAEQNADDDDEGAINPPQMSRPVTQEMHDRLNRKLDEMRAREIATMPESRVQWIADSLHPRYSRHGKQVQMSEAASGESLCSPHVEVSFPVAKKAESVSDERADQVVKELFPWRLR
jgi:hypothetical protein